MSFRILRTARQPCSMLRITQPLRSPLLPTFSRLVSRRSSPVIPDDDYEFNDPTEHKPREEFNADAALAAAAIVPENQSPNDPLHWDTETFIAWLKDMRPDLDSDIEGAFRYSKVTGIDLLNMTPPEMFRLMRRSMRATGKVHVQVDDVMIQSTVVQCYKYGRGLC